MLEKKNPDIQMPGFFHEYIVKLSSCTKKWSACWYTQLTMISHLRVAQDECGLDAPKQKKAEWYGEKLRKKQEKIKPEKKKRKEKKNAPYLRATNTLSSSRSYLSKGSLSRERKKTNKTE